MQQINIAICGLGTVGGSTLKILQEQTSELQTKSGLHIKVTHIAWRTPKDNLNTNNIVTTTDTLAAVTAENVDIIVETIGGVGIAKQV
ncbi:homoserine dehydrogenase, partial [Gammaproteobacteria bacterium]|nr:homoserine dehydrogenase [Gammaproteobacteria bacterium]